MRRAALALFVPAMLLAACIPDSGGKPGQPGETVATPPAEDACGATGLQNLLGQPASSLDSMRFSQPLRVIRPGMAVTMDFSAERLNIDIDQNEKISRITCG